MVDVKFYAVEALPARLSSADDGVYFVKGRTAIVFKYYVVSNGRAYEIDAITVDRLNQALSVKFDKPNGTELQYIKGNGTYGTMNKQAVGLGNVDNTSDLNKPISTATQNALNRKAEDNMVVHIDGGETIFGEKTFTKAVVSPTYPTDDFHLTNKVYVDRAIEEMSTTEGEFLRKFEKNEVGESFTIERHYGVPLENKNVFKIITDVRADGTPTSYIGVDDDNGEGVRMELTNEDIKVRSIDGDDDSMTTDGRKISFSQYAPNKSPNDAAQMKDVEDIKQWVINNFLSLNGGTVNGDITANKFFEK